MKKGILAYAILFLIFCLCFLVFVTLTKEKCEVYLAKPKNFDGSRKTPRILHSGSSIDSSVDLYMSEQDEEKAEQNVKTRTKIVVATVSCGNSEYLLTLLKSSVIFTLDEQISLHFIIFTDPENIRNLYKTVKAFVRKAQSEGFARNFSYETRPVWFPSPEKTGVNWREMYKNCSTQRLFFPSILPKVDALIYLDADTIIFGNLTQVWTEFSRMDSQQMIAMAPDSTLTYNSDKGIPFVGSVGVNAGVTLMNLTRLRQFQFEKQVHEKYEIYSWFITLADQDLINIIFHDKPKYIKILSCRFNFIWLRCLTDHRCADAQEKGVLIFHGAGGSFQPNEFSSSVFPLIYNKMKNFQLSESPLSLLEEFEKEWNDLEGWDCASTFPEILVRNPIKYFVGQEYKIVRDIIEN